MRPEMNGCLRCNKNAPILRLPVSQEALLLYDIDGLLFDVPEDQQLIQDTNANVFVFEQIGYQQMQEDQVAPQASSTLEFELKYPVNRIQNILDVSLSNSSKQPATFEEGFYYAFSRCSTEVDMKTIGLTVNASPLPHNQDDYGELEAFVKAFDGEDPDAETYYTNDYPESDYYESGQSDGELSSTEE